MNHTNHKDIITTGLLIHFIVFAFSCYKFDYSHLAPIEKVNLIFEAYMFNFVIGISAIISYFIGRGISEIILKKMGAR